MNASQANRPGGVCFKADWRVAIGMGDAQFSVIDRLVDSGLKLKEAEVVVALAQSKPLKASEIGQLVGITRMDAYNTLRRLQDRGLVMTTVDKPMRFTALPIFEVFQNFIFEEEAELRRLKTHLSELESGVTASQHMMDNSQAEPKFSVVKERTYIQAAMERLIQDSETQVWLMLGRWGIMHLVKTGALAAANEASLRGVCVRVLSTLDERTLKFYRELDDSIEVRHCESFSLHGCIVDDEVAVQILTMESNPVGRGREDAALVIEATEFVAAQAELVAASWGNAASFSAARTRLEDGQIVEPLKVTLGGGSFYQRLKELVASNYQDQHPASIGWTNSILRRGSEVLSPEPTLPTFEALGIDTSEVFRSVGRRIGEEIAIELQDVADDDGFWADLSHQWQELGMGELVVEGDPPTSIRVIDSGSCGGAPKLGGPFCHLDEGILEGIIQTRFGVSASAVERECTSTGDNHCHFDITFAQLDV